MFMLRLCICPSPECVDRMWLDLCRTNQHRQKEKRNSLRLWVWVVCAGTCLGLWRSLVININCVTAEVATFNCTFHNRKIPILHSVYNNVHLMKNSKFITLHYNGNFVMKINEKIWKCWSDLNRHILSAYSCFGVLEQQEEENSEFQEFRNWTISSCCRCSCCLNRLGWW